MSKTSKTLTQYGNLKFDLDFFSSKIQANQQGCYVWTGAQHRQGYGMVGGWRGPNNDRFMTVTHRVAMMYHLGREITHDEYVIHNCGNNLCCNPAHLILGDAKLRTARMDKVGGPRKTRVKGLKYNRTYKYTEQEVRWIRQANTLDIAEKYNINRTQAGVLRNRLNKTYQWVK